MPCQHEAYQGRCVHCDAPFKNGQAVFEPDANAAEIARLRAALTQIARSGAQCSVCWHGKAMYEVATAALEAR